MMYMGLYIEYIMYIKGIVYNIAGLSEKKMKIFRKAKNLLNIKLNIPAFTLESLGVIINGSNK